jgi:hypothetical protein
MIPPIAKNGRLLVGVLAEHFPDGGTCEDLRRRFEKETAFGWQTFYDALRYAKEQQWVVADGRIYKLDPAGAWKPPVPSVGEQLEAARRENDRLDFVAESRLERIDQLQDRLDILRDWVGGANGVAVEHLIKIVADSSTTPRQKLRAAGVVLGYKVDPQIAEFVKAFLEHLCMSPDTPTDYKIEAGEILRKAEGSPRIAPAVERPAPPVRDADPVAEAEERRIVAERRRRHLEEQARKDAEALKQEWKEHGWRWPVPGDDVPPA